MQVDFIDLHRENAPSSEVSSVMAFVCRLKPRKGQVILPRLTEHQIPMEFFKSICKGENISLPDGRTFEAKEFVSAEFAGGNFLGELKEHLCYANGKIIQK